MSSSSGAEVFQGSADRLRSPSRQPFQGTPPAGKGNGPDGLRVGGDGKSDQMKRLTTDADLIECFWSLVDKNGPLPEKSTGVKSRCWLWTGSIRRDGYGRFRFERRIFSPTRFAWKLKTGRDPGPLTISTHCQNKTCVRHLFSRTRSDLGRASGGHPALLGEDHPNARLTSKQVLQIRELYATGKFLQKDLAVRFDISRPALRRIVRKLTWRHL
jgi:hypothetical protein